MILLCVRFLGIVPTIDSSLDLTTVSELKNNKIILGGVFLLSVSLLLCVSHSRFTWYAFPVHYMSPCLFLGDISQNLQYIQLQYDTFIMIFHLHSFFPRILINRNRRQNGMQRFFTINIPITLHEWLVILLMATRNPKANHLGYTEPCK